MCSYKNCPGRIWGTRLCIPVRIIFYIKRSIQNSVPVGTEISCWSLYIYRLDLLVWGTQGPRTGGYNLHKTREAMWPYLDDILDHIRQPRISSSYVNCQGMVTLPWRVLYNQKKKFVLVKMWPTCLLCSSGNRSVHNKQTLQDNW